MGCIVNGPGEMADADFGYVGGAPNKINLYVNKTPVKFNIPEDEAVDRLIDLIKEHDKWIEPLLLLLKSNIMTPLVTLTPGAYGTVFSWMLPHRYSLPSWRGSFIHGCAVLSPAFSGIKSARLTPPFSVHSRSSVASSSLSRSP
ncbi:flavodoxin-dependent (E)-4-hydroxy-3-methylbut-2-enyl-diphosphate synthase [Rubritalea tangerina]|uniref:flavodoxin-dependent (E)-4-hydroxy-3-methylbut-2-enyl-diphosphate synthase n=1 Tax=Rubritalea tangerina TaxID=430798 RepID=UPI003614DB3F